MLERILEPEVMDTKEDAEQYNAIPNDEVNIAYVNEVLAILPKNARSLIDLGAGPAHIPILFANKHPKIKITAVELADSMLDVANFNIKKYNLEERVYLEKQDVKKTNFKNHSFDVVISNSIVHHIHQPIDIFSEANRLAGAGSVIYFKDLLRPKTLNELEMLVEKHSANVNDYQRDLFYHSLHAALTLDEVSDFAKAANLENVEIKQTSDRHWVLISNKKGDILC